MKIGDKIRKIPLSGKSNKIEEMTVKIIIPGKMIVAEHKKGYLESFIKADIVNPQLFKLDVKEGKEWRYLTLDDLK